MRRVSRYALLWVGRNHGQQGSVVLTFHHIPHRSGVSKHLQNILRRLAGIHLRSSSKFESKCPKRALFNESTRPRGERPAGPPGTYRASSGRVSDGPQASKVDSVQLYGLNRRRARGSQISHSSSPFWRGRVLRFGAAPPCISHNSPIIVCPAEFCRVFPVSKSQ